MQAGRRAGKISSRSLILYPIAAALAGVLAGCGGGLSLTGGSVPVGRAALLGVVVHADNVSTPVPGATLSLIANGRAAITRADGDSTSPRDGGSGGSGGGGGGGGNVGGGGSGGVFLPIVSRTSADDGTFDFGQFDGGPFVFQAAGPASSNLGASYSWPIVIPTGSTTQVVVALWPSWFKPESVASVSVRPVPYTIRVGESIHYTATVTGTDGNTIPLNTSWLLTGGLGDLSADGTFTARKTGLGGITAWIGGKSASAPVTVIP